MIHRNLGGELPLQEACTQKLPPPSVWLSQGRNSAVQDLEGKSYQEERHGTSPLPALQVPGFNLSGFPQPRGFPRRSPSARRAQQFLPPNSSSAEGRPRQRPCKEQRRRKNRNAAGLENVIDFSHALPILTSGFPKFTAATTAGLQLPTSPARRKSLRMG